MPNHKFKLQQVVRVVANETGHGFEMNDNVRIWDQRTLGNGRNYYRVKYLCGACSTYVYETDLAALKPTTKTTA